VAVSRSGTADGRSLLGGSRRRGPAVMLIAIVVSGLGACSNDHARDALSQRRSTSTTHEATSSTSAPTAGAPPTDGQCASGSSPAVYDPATGTYAVYVAAVDPDARTMNFDVIQFLVGQDADEAYHRDHPDDPEGPPNDYYIVNASSQTYTAAVAADVRVRLVRLAQDRNADLNAGTFEELPRYLTSARREPGSPSLSSLTFWLSLRGSQVVDICEQYRP
jgi:hypothetical protein